MEKWCQKAGIEWIIIPVAGTVLCSGFSTITVLITHWWFSRCWVALTPSRGLFNFHTAPTVRRLGGHKKLAGDIARTADPSWTKGYSPPRGIMLNNNTGWSQLGGWQPPAQGLAGHQSAGAEQSHSHHLLCIFYYWFPFLFCPTKLSLSQPTSFTFVTILSPIPLRGGNGCVCSAAWWLKSQQLDIKTWESP